MFCCPWVWYPIRGQNFLFSSSPNRIMSHEIMNPRPNIIVIFPDQLRRQALGCYGDPNVATPNIDRMAREGVAFDNACTSYPVCVPFRFTLMTGLYGHARNVPCIGYRLDPAERTLADEFNENGYHTIYVGKWHLADIGGTAVKPVPPENQGRWQKWYGFDLRNSHFDTYYFEDDDPAPKPLNAYQTDGLFDLAMNYIRDGRPRDEPFCCVISVEPPHFPYEAPAEYEARWKDRELKLPATFEQESDYFVPHSSWPNDADDHTAKKLRNDRIYYAMIENLDDNVGRLKAFLDENGLAKNTILVLFADHGEMGGMHRMATALKETSFEEAIGIPLIVCDPRHPERAGTRIGDVTCTEDLYPTLCGLAGFAPENNDLPGLDLAPLMRGEIASPDREGILLEVVREHRPEACFYRRAFRGFRTRRWKYTVLYEEDDLENPTPWQLFDLENDPIEQHNLIDDPAHRETRNDLHAKLQQLMRDANDSLDLPAVY